MASRPMPATPNLNQLRRRAKELRDAARAGDPAALERIAAHVDERPQGPVSLSVAQMVLAREHGFASWPRLKAEVEAKALDRAGRVEAFLTASVTGRGSLAGRLLVEFGLGAGDATRALPGALGKDSPAVVEALLAAGADPNTVGRDGLSARRIAVRRGRDDVAAVLTRYGAVDDATDADRLLGVCRRGDRQEARRLLAEYPDLPGRLIRDDHAAFVDAAEYAGVGPVALMLDLGFPVGVYRSVDGATALHAASYAGRLDVVRLLLDRGADIDTTDRQWGRPRWHGRRSATGNAPPTARTAAGPPPSVSCSPPGRPGTVRGSGESRPATRSPSFSPATASARPTTTIRRRPNRLRRRPAGSASSCAQRSTPATTRRSPTCCTPTSAGAADQPAATAAPTSWSGTSCYAPKGSVRPSRR
ncbi:ankyrin repeat domain-containing protein [Frankia sp. Cas3]|uniref:ankyrin repeat domain-containing protein n=1 Tax=Frankia sp. Cas3 TaxID=3073926 RepID=UPI002AD599CF|nr:ankyrin repeat domain-containing protein [Frankia sp. Cas3]